MKDRRILSAVWVVIGAVLIGLAWANKVDAFWNSMGTGLLVIGILQLLRFHRFNKNEAYREKMEIEVNDERNHFIRNKAWAWSGYLFIILTGLGTIVFKIMGNETMSMASASAVCLMLVLYWISYYVLKKKY